MILLVSSVFPPEPVVSAMVGNDLADALSDNWEVKVITPKPTRPMGFAFEKETIGNRKFEQIIINSYTCPESRLFGRMRESYSFGKHIVNYIKENKTKINLIFIHSWPLFGPYLIARISKRYSIPFVIHVVDIYPEALIGKIPFFGFFSRLLITMDKFILQNSSKVITISSSMKNLLVKTRTLDEAKVTVIQNWQNEDLYKNNKDLKSPNQENSALTFMFLGNLSKTAAIDTLISAFKKSAIVNSRLIIAGDGSEKRKLISMAETNQGGKIEFWDAPFTKVPEIQNKADVLLLSLKKGIAKIALPSKLPAYMFSAKPIIACVDEESDAANAIKQAQCGWIITPENIDALADTLKAVSSISKAELQTYGENGFSYAMENYSKKKNLQKMISIINEVNNSRFF